MTTFEDKYNGPPTCLRMSTWEVAPYCDECGRQVDFKTWRANQRHCSVACRPAWHLAHDGRMCKRDGCPNEIPSSRGNGRPAEFCSEGCKGSNKVESKRLRRAGLPTIEEQRAAENRPTLGDWLPGDPFGPKVQSATGPVCLGTILLREWATMIDRDAGWLEVVDVRAATFHPQHDGGDSPLRWKDTPTGKPWSFKRWLRWGGDFPGMSRGWTVPSRRPGGPALHPTPAPVLGSWDMTEPIPMEREFTVTDGKPAVNLLIPGRELTCPHCGHSARPGSDRHCRDCCQTFAGVTAFDRHLRGGRCGGLRRVETVPKAA